MPRPSYTPLPESPAIGDPDFAIKADAFNGALPVHADYLEALADWLQSDFYAELSNGSAASPSMRFASDQDLGLYRAGANKLGIAASAGVVLDGLLSGLAVTQSATDTTAGRVLKVGDFGIGVADAPPDVGNIDDATLPTGNYRIHSGAMGGVYPPGIPQGSGMVLEVRRYNSLHAYQIARRAFDDKNGIWERHLDEGVWSAWRQVSAVSILGAVSQSGGVPTGAIIERGGNANGEYIRFADGTQICTHSQTFADVNTAIGSVYNSTDFVRWVFPAAFAFNPVVSGGAGSTTRTLAVGTPTMAYCDFRAQSPTASTTPNTSRLLAIGRWF